MPAQVPFHLGWSLDFKIFIESAVTKQLPDRDIRFVLNIIWKGILHRTLERHQLIWCASCSYKIRRYSYTNPQVQETTPCWSSIWVSRRCFGFETGLHVVRSYCKLTVQLRITLNYRLSCFYFLSDGATGMCYHTQFTWRSGLNSAFHASKTRTPLLNYIAISRRDFFWDFIITTTFIPPLYKPSHIPSSPLFSFKFMASYKLIIIACTYCHLFINLLTVKNTNWFGICSLTY